MRHRPKYMRRSRINSLAMMLMSAWLWFITLPSTGVAPVLPDGSRFHASRGYRGSVYATQDGQHYIRTGNAGSIRIGRNLGTALLAEQLKKRKREIVKRVGLVSAVSLVAVGLAALSTV